MHTHSLRHTEDPSYWTISIWNISLHNYADILSLSLSSLSFCHTHTHTHTHKYTPTGCFKWISLLRRERQPEEKKSVVYILLVNSSDPVSAAWLPSLGHAHRQ